MSFAIDVNILLYASDESSPKHEAARSFLNACVRREELFCLGWPTIMAYVRMSTHPSLFRRPLDPSVALRNIESLLNLPHVRTLSEQEGFLDVYRRTVADVPTRGNLVPDAHLAALMRQHGIKRLYTHDRDFLKFRFLEVIDPLE